MKSFNPYLNFDGNAREAMTFYAKAFGEELYAQTFAEANMNPPGAENRLVHARIGCPDGVRHSAGHAGQAGEQLSHQH